MAVPPSEDRATHNQMDTTSIPHDALENAGGTRGSTTWEAPDHSHAAFVADEGSETILAKLKDAAEAFVRDLFDGTSISLKYNAGWQKLGGAKRKLEYNAKVPHHRTSHERPVVTCAVRDHKAGETQKFDSYDVFDDLYREWLERRRALTAEERAAWKARHAERLRANAQAAREREHKQRLAEQKAKQEEAERAEYIRTAIERYGRLPTTGKSPYLVRKLGDSDVPGTRFDGKTVVYALTDPASKQVVGLQRIKPDGEKKTVWGSVLQGTGVFMTGLPPKNFTGTIRVGESVTTTETARRAKADGAHYAASMSAGNLQDLAAKLEQRCPKATLELILDNDWQTALEFDENGKPKPNTGLEVGHKLAMRRGYRVLQPDFGAFKGQDAFGTLSDFNDLFKAAGMEEVRRQLVPRDADPEWAFKGVRERECRRLRALFGKHDLTVVNRRHLGSAWIEKGQDNATRSSHGTGKDYGAIQFVAENPDLSVLHVCPTIALCENTAAKYKDLGGVSYRHPSVRNNDEALRRARRLTITPDSLVRLTSSGAALPYYDVVIIDEPSHILERLLSKMWQKKLVLDTLRCVLQRAETTVWLDADLDTPTVNLWARWLPESRFNVVLNDYLTGTGRTFTVLKEQAEMQTLALELLGQGERVCYNTNTKKPGRAAQLLIQERLPEVRTLYVSADNSGDEEVEEFFKDVAGTVADLDCLIYTPKISTGVSIDQPHDFSAVLSEISTSADVGTPNGAVQQAERARDVLQKYVWLEGANARTYTTDPDEIAARWGESHTWDAELLGLTAGGKRGLSDPVYEGIAQDVTLQNNRAKRHFRWEFLRQLYLRGYRIEFADRRTVDAGAEADDPIAVRRALEQEAHEAEAVANDRNDGLRAKELAQKQNPTGTDTAELTAYRARQTFALDDGEALTTEHIKQFRRGSLLREVKRLETAAADQATLRLLSERQHEEGELYARDMRLYGVEGTVYRWVLEALNVTPETLEVHDETPVNAQSPGIKRLIEKLVRHRKAIQGAGIALSEPDRMRAVPMTVVGNLLKRLNLKTRSAGRNQPQRPRVIDPEQLAYMREIVLRRRERATRIAESVNETGNAYIKGNTLPVSPALELVLTTFHPAQEAVNPPAETAPSVPEPVALPAYELSPWHIPHYEGLRAFVREAEPGPQREALLESFNQADHRNPVALKAISAYLEDPAVQQLMGLTTPGASGQEVQQAA